MSNDKINNSVQCLDKVNGLPIVNNGTIDLTSLRLGPALCLSSNQRLAIFLFKFTIQKMLVLMLFPILPTSNRS